MDITEKKSNIGFRSFSYRSKYVYNFLTRRIFNQVEKFRIIGMLIGKNQKVLDIPCGTGFLTRFLHHSVEYEGWDLNRHFLKILYKDYCRGRFKVKKFMLREKNIFDFQDYPNGSKDIFVICDILHHVYPRHIELINNAKQHAKKVIICEPLAAKPQYLNAHDPIGKTTMFFTKYIPERIYRILDHLFADNDGINPYNQRNGWHHNRASLKKFYESLGFNRIYKVKDEFIGIWEN